MSDPIDDLFEDADFVTTPAVARFRGLSESQTRALAASLNVSKAGQAFIWSREDVERLAEELDVDDAEDETADDPDEAEESTCTDDDCACVGHDGETDECDDDSCPCVDHDDEADDE